MIADRLQRSVGEVRDGLSGLQNPTEWLVSAFGGGTTIAGPRVNQTTALTIPAYYAGVKILAETMGSMPCEVRRYDDDTSEVHLPARDSDIWPLLHDKPNPEMHAGDFWECITTHLAMRGNAYCFRQRDGMGVVRALWPIPPQLVEVQREPITRRKVFLVSPDPEAAVAMELYSDDILHFRGFGPDPLRGLSPIGALRELLGRALAEQNHQSAQMKNGVRPSGVLHTDRKIDRVTGRRLARQFKRAVAGSHNAGETVILEQGLQWKQVALSAADAQFIEQREFTVRDIARTLRLPNDMLLITSGDPLHYTSDESAGLRFLTWTMSPWTRRIEGPMSIDDSLPWKVGDAPRMFPRFQSNLLLAVDRKTRFEAWKIALDAGWISPDEVRIAEGRRPLGGGYAKPRLVVAKPPKDDRALTTGDVAGALDDVPEVDEVLADLVA